MRQNRWILEMKFMHKINDIDGRGRHLWYLEYVIIHQLNVAVEKNVLKPKNYYVFVGAWCMLKWFEKMKFSW